MRDRLFDLEIKKTQIIIIIIKCKNLLKTHNKIDLA